MPFEIIPSEFVVTVDTTGGDGVNSQRVQFASVKVPSQASPMFPYGTYGELVFPLGAVSTKHERGPTTCNTATSWKNDCISRVSVFVSEIQVPVDVTPSQNWRLSLQVRASNVCIPMGLRQYDFEFVPFGAGPGTITYRSGLVAQYGGPLCTQFELWGRVINIDPLEPDPPDIKLTFTLAVDRLASVETSITGIGVTDLGKSITLPQYY